MHALRCLTGSGIPVGKAFGEGIKRRLSYVLGIETSCDDTGIAIVDTAGRVRANVLESQQEFHTR